MTPRLIGKPAHLAFELTWPAMTHPDVTGIGWGALRLWVGGHLIWADRHSEPLNWSWIDLVEHLARAWGHLECEQHAPFGLTAPHPGLLRPRRPGLFEAFEAEEAVHAFQQRHDLAAGLKGLFLEPVWLLREGTLMHLHARQHDVLAPFDETTNVLENFVAEVREHTPSPQSRARKAFADWDTRGASADLRLRFTATEPSA